MRVLILVVSVASAVVVVLGLVPSDDAMLDTASFFRPVFAGAAALGLFVTHGWARAGVALVVLAAVASLWVSLPPRQTGGDLRIYTKNIRYDNGAIAPVRDDILASGASVVAMQELSPANLAILDQLKPDFPHQTLCGQGTLFAIAVLSKTPFSDAPRCSQTRGLAAAQVRLDGGAVWVVSVHWPWPWPAGGRSSDDHMRALLSGLAGPVVLAGDFNTLPWTHRMARAMRLTGNQRAGPTPLTLWHRRLWMPLPLDYVLAPGGGTLEARPLLGSDHLGLVAEVSVF